MTREQKLEAALRRIEDLALDDMLDLIGDIAREALATPPDTYTRVVSVADMDRIIDEMNITVSLAHALDDGGVSDEYEDILRAELDALVAGIDAYSKLRAIIEGKDQ